MTGHWTEWDGYVMGLRGADVRSEMGERSMEEDSLRARAMGRDLIADEAEDAVFEGNLL
jgi:hypothetical protein